VPPGGDGFSLLSEYVVWDCPDMTTWAATGYVPRLIEVAGLADVVVYVASDERYNDEVPTQFLAMLLQAGKPVIVCLTKMREADAPAILEHFRREVLGRLEGHNRAVVLAIPFLPPEVLEDPAKQAGPHRIGLLNQVLALGQPPAACRERSVRAANDYFGVAGRTLTQVARQDLEALEKWTAAVQAGRAEFEARYFREFLAGEKFRRFDEALVRLIDLLELPGVGKVVSGALWVARTPYRLVRGALGKMLKRPEGVQMLEQPVLDAAFAAWLDGLRTEALKRTGTHPLWAHVARGFDEGLTGAARDRFQQAFRNYQLGMADEIDKTARSIYADLEQSPAKLNALRGGKLIIDSAGITMVLAAGGINVWDFVLVPLAASLTHQMTEWFGQSYVITRREQARQRQKELVETHLAAPLAEWLTAWPATGGSSFERLQQVLRRVPAALKQLDAAVSARLANAPAPRVAS
jgi:hypothetical protein